MVLINKVFFFDFKYAYWYFYFIYIYYVSFKISIVKYLNQKEYLPNAATKCKPYLSVQL